MYFMEVPIQVLRVTIILVELVVTRMFVIIKVLLEWVLEVRVQRIVELVLQVIIEQVLLESVLDLKVRRFNELVLLVIIELSIDRSVLIQLQVLIV